MTQNRDLGTYVSDWLTDGPTTFPAASLEDALARVAVTPQHAPRWREWSLRAAVMPAIWAVAIVTLLAAVVTGMIGFDRGPAATQMSPSPSSAPPSTTGTPVPLQLSGSNLQAGTTYLVGPPFPIAITFQVPAHWEYSYMEHNVAGVDTSGVAGVLFVTPEDITVDPCHWKGPVRPMADATGAELLDALSSLPHAAVSDAVPVEVGGYWGWEITRNVDPDLTGCDDGELKTFASQGLPITAGEHQVLYLLDVRGRQLVIQTWAIGKASAWHVQDLAQIVASLDLK